MKLRRTALFPIAMIATFSSVSCVQIYRGAQDIALRELSVRTENFARDFEYDEAVASLNLAIGLAPRIPELYVLRGQMYLNLYEWDKSLEDYNTAIDLAPVYAEAYFQRGVLYYSILQTGQSLREEALADFRHYLDLAPGGEYALQAADYAGKIEAELAALNEQRQRDNP